LNTSKRKLNLLICIHNHQPEGNFEHIFREAFNKCYRPFLDTLENFRKIKLSLHFSGPLLEWLERNEPQFLERIKRLVEDKRIEILGSGFFEPILAIIPKQDAIDQIKLYSEKLEKIFNTKIKGIWLTERVWEPHLPEILSQVKISYTITDDEHFVLVGFDREELDGFYLTEFNNKKINIFAGSKTLRYLIPFKPLEDLKKYLYEKYEKGIKSICYADDGEKFGMWPHTYDWVYNKKWLEKFFEFLETADWIELRLFSEFLENNTPQKLVYLKSASYQEMLEWSGGFFRNFFTKYTEANYLHKRMYYISRRIQKLKTPGKERAKYFLFKAQNNDAYWHGIFGGLYLNHLRNSVYSNLIKAEKIVDAHLDFSLKEDIDFDGYPEFIIKNKTQKIIFSKNSHILEWDILGKDLNIVNTLTRRKEPYHKIIFEKCKNKNSESVASIHENKKIKDQGLEKFLIYDNYRKVSLIEHFLRSELDLESFLKNEFLGDKILYNKIFEVIDHKKDFIIFKFKDQDIDLTKEVKIDNNCVIVNYEINFLNSVFKNNKFGVEFNLSGFNERYKDPTELKESTQFEFFDEWFKIIYKFEFSEAIQVFVTPIYTISDSEAGIEKTLQHTCFLFSFPLKKNLNLKISLSYD